MTAVPGRRPIAVVTHSHFEEDPRVRRQVDALVAAGWPVDVIALRQAGEDPDGLVAGANVWRANVQRHQGAGAGTYLREYLAFFLAAMVRLVRSQPRRRYALVQVATLPDWLVFAALPLRLTGVPVLLDLHEAMPDFFATRFPGLARPWTRGLLRVTERASLAAATHAITANSALQARLVRLGAREDRVDVVPNSVALARFDPAGHPSRSFMADGHLRLVYAGALTPTYELDVVIHAIALIRARRPDLAIGLDLYGRGDAEASLRALAGELGLGEVVRFHGRIPIDAVPGAIAEADIGLAPTRLDPFTRSSLSTKIFEYAAMARPVVASRLPLIESELPPDGIAVYEPGDAESLAARILEAVDEPAARDGRVAALRAWVQARSWEADAARYVGLVERLVAGRRGSTPG